MSISRTTLWLSFLVLATGLSAQARAQFPTTNHQFGGAGFWEPDNPGLVQPQIPPNYFEPDLQFFAPADVSTFGGYPEPNIGFFFSYERLYWNVQRSETEDAPFQGDFTWGNRVELGYMMDTDHGWLLSAFHLDGPNVDSRTTTIQGPPFVNPPAPAGTTVRTLVGTTAVNNVDFEGVEFNKVWRWKPIGKNYIVEPMFGPRFMRVIDRHGTAGIITDFNNMGEVLQTVASGSYETTENNILGGQLGLRIHHQTERWVTSIESRFLPAINYQFYGTEDFSEFTIFGQVIGKATYKLTRDISLGAGFDIQHFGRGIARGPLVGQVGQPNALREAPINDQDLTIGGFSVVVEINR